jgi:hypothetical protein
METSTNASPPLTPSSSATPLNLVKATEASSLNSISSASPAALPAQRALTSVKIEGSIPVELQAKQLSAGDIILTNIPFLVTIVIVIAAATVNYFVNRKTINNQDHNARKGRQAEHQNKISEYRHAWLQELRDTAAELIQKIYEAQNYLMQWNLTRERREHGGTDEQIAEWTERLVELWKQEKNAAAEMYKYVAKLKLLFKKNDPQVTQLFILLDATLAKVGDLKLVHVDDASIAMIIAELQIILKDEWEVTKTRIGDESKTRDRNQPAS